MGHRKEQIESVLRRAISMVILRDMSDPRIAGMVSVTRIEVNKDMLEARVFVSILPDKYEKRTLAGLRSAVGRIHSKVAQKVHMRSVPRFDFRLDSTLKKEAVIFDAIQEGLSRDGIGPDELAQERETANQEHGEADANQVDADQADVGQAEADHVESGPEGSDPQGHADEKAADG
jgi:ribosome-binding factor A